MLKKSSKCDLLGLLATGITESIPFTNKNGNNQTPSSMIYGYLIRRIMSLVVEILYGSESPQMSFFDIYKFRKFLF